MHGLYKHHNNMYVMLSSISCWNSNLHIVVFFYLFFSSAFLPFIFPSKKLSSFNGWRLTAGPSIGGGPSFEGEPAATHSCQAILLRNRNTFESLSRYQPVLSNVIQFD
jgi:hypothetical protein